MPTGLIIIIGKRESEQAWRACAKTHSSSLQCYWIWSVREIGILLPVTRASVAGYCVAAITKMFRNERLGIPFIISAGPAGFGKMMHNTRSPTPTFRSCTVLQILGPLHFSLGSIKYLDLHPSIQERQGDLPQPHEGQRRLQFAWKNHNFIFKEISPSIKLLTYFTMPSI